MSVQYKEEQEMHVHEIIERIENLKRDLLIINKNIEYFINERNAQNSEVKDKLIDLDYYINELHVEKQSLMNLIKSLSTQLSLWL